MNNRAKLTDNDSRFSSSDVSGMDPPETVSIENAENNLDELEGTQSFSGIDKKMHPIPVGIKIAMGISAALFTLIIASVFMFSDNDEKNVATIKSDTQNAHITPDELMGVSGDAQKPDEIAGMLGLPDDTSSGIPPPVRAASNGDATTPSASIDTQVTTHNTATVDPFVSDQVADVKLVPELDVIKEMLDEHAAGLSKLTTAVNRIEGEELSDINNQIETVKDSMRITQDIVNKHELYVSDLLKVKALLPPFELLSIDIWGNATSAVILMDNKTSFASIGDSRAGWQIVSIMKPDCISVQRVNQTSIKICRKVSI